MEVIDKFYNYLNDLLQNHTKLALLLKEKLVAVDTFDAGKLDSIMKEEQVHVLLTKSFDSTVASYREKLNVTGDTLSQIITELPEEQKHRFQSLLTALKSKLDEVKGLNEACQNLIEKKIYLIDRSLKSLDKSDTAKYGKTGSSKKDAAGLSVFSKTI